MILPDLAGAQRSGSTTTLNVCAGAPSDMVCVSAGSFSMGSAIGDADELPVHTVKISEFLIDKYEVSFGQYMKCVQSQKCGMPRYYPPLKARKVKAKVIRKLPKGKRKGKAKKTAPKAAHPRA